MGRNHADPPRAAKLRAIRRSIPTGRKTITIRSLLAIDKNAKTQTTEPLSLQENAERRPEKSA
jgi:hypothetical protein